MESRKETASAKKASGAYNCTQAVCCTYHDFTGLDEETIKHAGNSFAVGMGNMEGTCGALIGAGIVYGLFTKDKAKSARGMRQIMEKFQQRRHPMQASERRRHWQDAARMQDVCGRRVGISRRLADPRNEVICKLKNK